MKFKPRTVSAAAAATATTDNYLVTRPHSSLPHTLCERFHSLLTVKAFSSTLTTVLHFPRIVNCLESYITQTHTPLFTTHLPHTPYRSAAAATIPFASQPQHIDDASRLRGCLTTASILVFIIYNSLRCLLPIIYYVCA